MQITKWKKPIENAAYCKIPPVFWKRQNYGDNKIQEVGRSLDENSQSTEDFGGSKNNVKKKMLKDGYMLLHICPDPLNVQY